MPSDTSILHGRSPAGTARACAELIATARRLQAPGGCPWDRAQTLDSLFPHLLEETWEAYDAMRRRDRRHLQEELGDVLYTTLFLILIAERRHRLELATLLRRTREKMVRRHPHVFGTARAASPGHAYRQWRAVKRQERGSGRNPPKALREVLGRLWTLLWEQPDSLDRLQRELAAWPDRRVRRRPAPRGKQRRQVSRRPSARSARQARTSTR